MPMSKSWLCRDDTDRERLLDMEERLKPVRTLAFGLVGVGLLAAGPWVGWWPLLPLVLAAVAWQTADAVLERTRRPEYVLFAAWTAGELMIAASVALADAQAAALAWLAIPVVTLTSRFSLRGVILGVAIAVGSLFAVAFGTDAGAMLDDPPLFIAPLVLILATAALSTALMRSDVEHRGEAVIDPLTGMLNRKALTNRVSELAQQSAVTHQQIGLIVGDLDRFKRVNDSLGHAAGDAVLKDVAYVIRKQLRAFDLAYRIGGEEFLGLVPGSDMEEATRLAELLRRTIAACSHGDGVRLTMSFGVSTSIAGDQFDFEQVFATADDALYEAKSGGRNQVRERPPVVFAGATLSPVRQTPSPATSTAS
jgi:diguanylate cyclase (GGDEF)-like protein